MQLVKHPQHIMHTHLTMRLNARFDNITAPDTFTHTAHRHKDVHLASLESVGVHGTNCALGC